MIRQDMPHISTYYNIKKCAFLEYRLLSIYSTRDFTYMIFISLYIECPMTFLDVNLDEHLMCVQGKTNND